MGDDSSQSESLSSFSHRLKGLKILVKSHNLRENKFSDFELLPDSKSLKP
jgi:hypothetical protein